MGREIVIASRNPGKIAEIHQILAGLGFSFRSLSDLPEAPCVEETGASYAENARLKAVAVAAFFGRRAIADDSGLEVDALGGRPGIRSARYGGPRATDEENNALLLRELEGVPEPRRTARYRAAVVLAAPDGRILAEAEGTCEGEIVRSPRGSAGFGYDPLFLVPGTGRTMAELGLEVKNRISHRAQALGRLREFLDRRFQEFY
ncbi:MAG: XTP/dITP diphosphatase [Planctomycetes bacterium]|nr:XTP/dITP diphosphatase [Planctomycetota bacterium]